MQFLNLNFDQRFKIDLKEAATNVNEANRKRKLVFEKALEEYGDYCFENNSTFDRDKYFMATYNLPLRTETQCKEVLKQDFHERRMFIRSIYKRFMSGKGFGQFDCPFIEGK